MNSQQYRHLVASDLYRIGGTATVASFLRQVLRGESFKFIFWMRTVAFLTAAGGLWRTGLPIARAMHRHYTYKFGISIPPQATIGSGLYIGHFGGIVVNAGATIGANCNLSQGVTIGQVNRGERRGSPTVGNNVYIGPGAKILGNITIGDDVAIGANAVVIRDVADHCVVGGVPARVISRAGSQGYVNRTDYPPAAP